MKGIKLAKKEEAKQAAVDEAAAADAAAAASSADAPDNKLLDKKSSAFGHVLEEITDFDKKKVEEARKAEKKRQKTVTQGLSLDDERNRKYSKLADDGKSGDLSPEEYEAYRLERTRGEDPMAKFM